MSKFMLVCVVVAVASFSSAKDAAAQDTAPTKLMVAPFQNTGYVRGQDYMQLQFAATVAERLEDVSGYEVADGPLVLTADLAELATIRNNKGKMSDFNLAEANRLAMSLGASVFITGRYNGTEEKWSLTAEVYSAQTNGPRLIGSATVHGSLMTKIMVRKRARYIVDIRAIHNLLSQAVAGAMRDAGLPNCDLVQTTLETPSTNDSWAFIQLGLAYIRYFNPPDVKHHRSTFELAKYAVLVDPKYAEAQRFYSVMLEKRAEEKPADRGKILGLVRLHYEMSLALRPNDTRTLIPLAKVELQSKNEVIAKEYLVRAVTIHPKDPEPHFWLAKVYLKLENSDAAIAEFEIVRTLSPARLDARRELVRLYNVRLRYLDSATELRVIVAAEPSDLQAAFALPAVLRAADEIHLAVQAYTDAEQRFPKEKRFAKFRADVERREGGLFVWVDAINEGKYTVENINDIRDIFQLAANDAAMDFSLNGKEACVNGRGASSMLLAQENERVHLEELQALRAYANTIRTVIKQGNDTAFTTNERDDAVTLLTALKTSERDSREMQMQTAKTIQSLMRKKSCKEIGPDVRMATVNELEKRNLNWQVVLPPVKSKSYVLEIPTSSVRPIHLFVNNKTGHSKCYLFLDGKQLGVIAAGQTNKDFTVSIGNHTYCLEEKAEDCDKPGTIRQMFFSEGIILERK